MHSGAGGTSPIAGIFVFVVIAFAILAILKKREPQILGHIGECRVRSCLDSLSQEEYLVLNDVIIGEDGKTAQIDHVVVSRYGVFVIETKNFSGWIYGSDRDEKWTQVFFARKHRFYNPLRQNEGHIRALKRLLSGVGEIPFYSIIAFTNDSTLKIEAEQDNVIQVGHLCGHIKAFRMSCISEAMRDEVFRRVKEANISDKRVRRGHVGFAQRRKWDVENAAITLVCPRCGGALVERKGKYGTFKGCSNYRKGCRFTAKGAGS